MNTTATATSEEQNVLKIHVASTNVLIGTLQHQCTNQINDIKNFRDIFNDSSTERKPTARYPYVLYVHTCICLCASVYMHTSVSHCLLVIYLRKNMQIIYLDLNNSFTFTKVSTKLLVLTMIRLLNVVNWVSRKIGNYYIRFTRFMPETIRRFVPY